MCARRPEEDSSKLTHAIHRSAGAPAEGRGDDSGWEGGHSLGIPGGQVCPRRDSTFAGATLNQKAYRKHQSLGKSNADGVSLRERGSQPGSHTEITGEL